MTSSEPSRLPATVLAFVKSISWRSVLRDLVLVVAWVGVVSLAFRMAGWPTWQYRVVAFGGVIAYSLAGGWWASRRDT